MAKGLSVHIGLNSVDPNHYNGWDGRLQACEYDAEDMKKVAEAKGFDATILRSKEATAERVSDAIKGAADELESGDCETRRVGLSGAVASLVSPCRS
jgi:hypothetical protein